MVFKEIIKKKVFLSLKFQRKSSFYIDFSASFLKNPFKGGQGDGDPSGIWQEFFKRQFRRA